MSAPTEAQIIRQDGKPVFAVLPIAQYAALLNRQGDKRATLTHAVVKWNVQDGERLLKAWRRWLGLSRAELAERAGVTQAQIARFEAGKGIPRAITPDPFLTRSQAAAFEERAAAQEHFTDLCRWQDLPTPAKADPSGIWSRFKHGAGTARTKRIFSSLIRLKKSSSPDGRVMQCICSGSTTHASTSNGRSRRVRRTASRSAPIWRTNRSEPAPRG